MDVEAEVSFAYDALLELTAGAPETKLELKLYVRDKHNRLLQSAPLLTHNTEAGAMRVGGSSSSRAFFERIAIVRPVCRRGAL